MPPKTHPPYSTPSQFSEKPQDTPTLNTASACWVKILENLSSKVPRQQFRAWIEPLHVLSIADGKLSIQAPTRFNSDWVKEHYSHTIEGIASEVFDTPMEVEFSVRSNTADQKKEGVVSEETMTSGSPFLSEKTEKLSVSSGKTKKSAKRIVDEAKAPTLPSSDGPGPLSLANQDALEQNFKKNQPNEFESILAEAPEPAFHEPAQTSILDTKTDLKESFKDSAAAISQPSTVTQKMVHVQNTAGPLNANLTFETFIVGSSNQFAHAACRSVTENPASQYNPLFLYSDAGLGKTHLLHAIGNAFKKRNPKARICYISAESFANDLIESLKAQKMPQFRQRYRDSFDILLMDDFQFIAGKDRTQEEFFHTFNALHSSRKQIVVTSDKSPKDIPGLEDRIRTRFECGLIADIHPPEIETRIAILKAKSERDDIFLPDNVAVFLASNIKSNIRELEGALIRLEAQASLNGVEITVDLARKELMAIVQEPVFVVSHDAILGAVCRHFGLRIADLKGRDRSRKVSMPRQIAMFLIRRYTGKSLPEIGICLGGKDHSTILHGIQSITKAADADPKIQEHIQSIQTLL